MTPRKNRNGNTARKPIFTAADDALSDALDELVANAARGDRDAVGAIAIAFGPMILAEAREALGPVHAQDDGDVLQDLCLALLEGTLLFPPGPGDAIGWLKRMVRELARARRRGGPERELGG